MIAAIRLALATALALLVLEQAGAARDLRHPTSGDPALTVSVPDDWSSTDDRVGNLLLHSADRSMGFSLTVTTGGEPLDKIAADAMEVAHATPPTGKAPFSISGYAGFSYDSTLTNASGTRLILKIFMVRIDADHIASCTRIEGPDVSPDQHALTERIVASLRVIGAGGGK